MGLIVKNVNKSFGDKHVVDNISFSLEEPGVFGLLGTNGAGKTTTIRMILGIIKKDSGEITWNGKAVTRGNVNFGYLPEERGLYPKSTIYDQLVYFANLKGLDKRAADKAVKMWLDKLNLMEYINSPAEKLSKGNQQKVQFITSMLHDPDLIVLDEPFSGLDPVNTEILSKIMKDLVKSGKYIIMSSHQMSVIEEFCSDLVILNRGKTVLSGNLKEIKDSYETNKVLIETTNEIDGILKKLKVDVLDKNDDEYLVSADADDRSKLLKELVKNNIDVKTFKVIKPTLHEIFIEKVGE
ncbi:MAG: ATP-binding cassette domain-containing protein [Tenericutes bacterium]|nr:ATP-binding cassette domain-containing protein [Mycoplasmatota bacterium]